MNDSKSTALQLVRDGIQDAGAGNRLLIVDDDKVFAHRLQRAMQARGFETCVAGTKSEALSEIARFNPDLAIVDIRLGHHYGLEIIEAIIAKNPSARCVVVSGYASLAGVVSAIKCGAVNYLAKPTDADAIHSALVNHSQQRAEIPDQPISSNRIKWEYIQRTFELCGRNVSRTAQALSMHRRTLQRILSKRAPV